MRVLWFTNTPSLYSSHSSYNGGGWIASLERCMRTVKEVELGVGFFHSDNCFKRKIKNTTYYPISIYKSIYRKILHNTLYSRHDSFEVRYLLKIVEDFKPDIIHVFGTEKSFGLISQWTNIPTVVHLQGLLNPYLNAYFAPGVNKFDYLTKYLSSPTKALTLLRNHNYFKHNAAREILILKSSKYLMGRTKWDKDVSSIYAGGARYFYCSEILRDDFYSSAAWQNVTKERLTIASTISQTEYKGFDLIVKAAMILKKVISIDFEWNVYGVNEYTRWEKQFGVKLEDINIYTKGVVDSSKLVQELQQSNLFVHPSYIDNSPNSVCEAQLLGLPVISTNVGGIASLIENEVTGILVPANDPFTLVARIIELCEDKDRAIMLGHAARQCAASRHDRGRILSDLMRIYNLIHG